MKTEEKCKAVNGNRVKPKIFIAENVYGLLTMKEKPIDIIMADFCRLGIDVAYQLVKTDEHGVPHLICNTDW